jgi:hypothetical protein
VKNWKLVSSAAILALATVTVAQDAKHAPTLESCADNISLWSSQMPGSPEPSNEQLRTWLKIWTARQIGAATKLIRECASAYPVLGAPKSGHESAALTLTTNFDDEVHTRYLDFIVRHGLMKQFAKEDDAGKR